MEAAYYWDGLDAEVLAWLHDHTKENEKIEFGPLSWENLRLMRQGGTLRRGCFPDDPGRYRWYVIQRRPGFWSVADRRLVEHWRPAFRKTIRSPSAGLGTLAARRAGRRSLWLRRLSTGGGAVRPSREKGRRGRGDRGWQGRGTRGGGEEKVFEKGTEPLPVPRLGLDGPAALRLPAAPNAQPATLAGAAATTVDSMQFFSA
ncbi:MAG TPA: hypothetical protein VGX78_08665 [Pirellulales bacterium]|jgi:hypothetical protein|nr:hypothetical protein [Pirellulales bacterium]